MIETRKKLLPEMEGVTARWYAKQRGTPSMLATFRRHAEQVTAGLPKGARILEVAPGPGYMTIEMSRQGAFEVTGLDISRTFVALATEHARAAGAAVTFLQGDVAKMPFEAGTYDRIVCEAAFKNFVEPVQALNEMHRVLRPGGVATILDLNRASTWKDIDEEVAGMKLSRFNSVATKLILGTVLRKRAYSADAFRTLAEKSLFGGAEIHARGVELEVRLRKVTATA